MSTTGMTIVLAEINEKMNLFLRSLLILSLPLCLSMGVHKFYVSVTQVEYYAPDRAIQITSRVFIDDLEKALEERYGVKLLLATEKESPQADTYIERYLEAKFAVRVNGDAIAYYFLGKKIDGDMAVLFLEVPDISLEALSTVEIQNEVLMDVFEEQKNIIHFKFGERKKSFVLLRERNTGMLNF